MFLNMTYELVHNFITTREMTLKVNIWFKRSRFLVDLMRFSNFKDHDKINIFNEF